MQDNQILYANLQGVCFFRFVGEVRHNQSSGLEVLINNLFNDAENVCDDVVVDLSQARYLDSTNLGLLAMIARKMLETHQHKPTLISTSKDMTTLLQSMCLEQVFHLIDRPLDAPDAFVEVADQSTDEKQRAKMILAAHEELLKLGDSNRQTFQPVVDLLKQDLQAREEQD
ncbi:STAS domain-containing protein [Lacimicrobium sp. SS2-24]|uniref:STAS domain-containing protein n=1 Tax=Lacimicrobium sp. SS2-24 TaxID=2005569 RepID=UPI000B4A9644|nr:STAS domain-containing protein [Lacimicrobium sp. SS2-24]